MPSEHNLYQTFEAGSYPRRVCFIAPMVTRLSKTSGQPGRPQNPDRSIELQPVPHTRLPAASTRTARPPCALTIAGSDSGGGAGIQADLKTFHSLGVHGLSAIAAITAQNTRGVRAIHPVPLRHLRAQLDALFEDFPVAAAKTGMLGDARSVRCVVRELARRRPPWLVVDPVMIATSGARLLDASATRLLRDELIPLADMLTPNLPEAETLLGAKIRNARDAERAARALLELGAGAVLLKGGHATGREAIDLFADACGVRAFRHARLLVRAHGTGCTLSAALAAQLAKGDSPRIATRRAIAFVQRALRHGYLAGGGDLLLLGHGNAAALT